MSIIERSLQRLQGTKLPPPSKRVFGRVVESAEPEAPAGRLIRIDQEALRAAGLLVPKSQERRIVAQYRQIKRPLVAAALGRGRDALPNGRLIVVASALSGEGKTFTSINLALSMAMENDIQVVLVDADVAKPQISKMFGIESEKGLLDALSDPTIQLGSLILRTDVPNLFLMSAGTPDDRATELLASDRMPEAMNWLLSRNSNRIYIFDSSPLLLTTEAPALAGAAGQIVVVVRADSTEHHVLEDALSRLPEDCSPSLILNQSAPTKLASYYYGYGDRDAS
jgi:protein-tyrosine kinase